MIDSYLLAFDLIKIEAATISFFFIVSSWKSFVFKRFFYVCEQSFLGLNFHPQNLYCAHCSLLVIYAFSSYWTCQHLDPFLHHLFHLHPPLLPSNTYCLAFRWLPIFAPHKRCHTRWERVCFRRGTLRASDQSKFQFSKKWPHHTASQTWLLCRCDRREQSYPLDECSPSSCRGCQSLSPRRRRGCLVRAKPHLLRSKCFARLTWIYWVRSVVATATIFRWYWRL